MSESGGKPPPSFVSTISATELFQMQLQPTPMIVPGLISVGLNILAGNPKAGKSWIALQLAHAVSQGGYFMNQHVSQGRVIYMALEDTLYRLRSRMQTLGLKPNDYLEFATTSETLKRGGLEAVHNTIHSQGDVKLVILDTLARVKDAAVGQGNVYEADAALGAALQQVAFGGEVAIMIVHHMAKAKGSKDFLLQVSGSAGLPGTADVVMGFERVRNQRFAKLHCTGRDIDERTIDLEWLGNGWQTFSEAQQEGYAKPYSD